MVTGGTPTRLRNARLKYAMQMYNALLTTDEGILPAWLAHAKRQ